MELDKKRAYAKIKLWLRKGYGDMDQMKGYRELYFEAVAKINEQRVLLNQLQEKVETLEENLTTVQNKATAELLSKMKQNLINKWDPKK